MRYNQFTEEEAVRIALDPNTIIEDSKHFDIYMQGENWGDDTLGTLADWANAIPEDENEAKMTGWYDWYRGDDRYYDDELDPGWRCFRAELLEELRKAEIIEDESED